MFGLGDRIHAVPPDASFAHVHDARCKKCPSGTHELVIPRRETRTMCASSVAAEERPPARRVYRVSCKLDN